MVTVVGINGAAGPDGPAAGAVCSARIPGCAGRGPGGRRPAVCWAATSARLAGWADSAPIRLGTAAARASTCVIDFSTRRERWRAAACIDRQHPAGGGHDGHTAAQKREIEAAAQHTALLLAPNMSLVVNVLFKLVAEAADRPARQGLRRGDHGTASSFKKDSPSGTALHFARIVQEAMGEQSLRHGREGLVGERPANEIGMHAVRAGDNVGEHTIIFSTLGETMELVHRASPPTATPAGPCGRQVPGGSARGRYTMKDVLGL